MIHVGDVVRDVSDGFQYRITVITEHGVSFEPITADTGLTGFTFDMSTGLPMVPDEFQVYSCGHSVTSVSVTNYAFDRTMAMAKNTGIMESAIASANAMLMRFSTSEVACDPNQVIALAIQARASLIRAAESLQDLPSVSGAPAVPWLKQHLS